MVAISSSTLLQPAHTTHTCTKKLQQVSIFYVKERLQYKEGRRDGFWLYQKFQYSTSDFTRERKPAGTAAASQEL